MYGGRMRFVGISSCARFVASRPMSSENAKRPHGDMLHCLISAAAAPGDDASPLRRTASVAGSADDDSLRLNSTPLLSHASTDMNALNLSSQISAIHAPSPCFFKRPWRCRNAATSEALQITGGCLKRRTLALSMSMPGRSRKYLIATTRLLLACVSEDRRATLSSRPPPLILKCSSSSCDQIWAPPQPQFVWPQEAPRRRRMRRGGRCLSRFTPQALCPRRATRRAE
mmetsp:Transcript_32420/g.99929  ORF Transcript_32420/g.99929 Transcript_32420/m.99929 type:complete len:228 (-) Transcript_32420:1149-1832(-)